MRKEFAPRQLPLELSHAEARSRDDLVVTPANAAAVALVESWPHWPAPLVVLAGPPGCGKTHLAEIWQSISGAVPVASQAIDAGALAAAERGPVLIEGADGSGRDETGLFHLINTVRGAHSHLLMTAHSLPPAWGVKLPDLLSRLRTAATVEVSAPDDMLLAGVVTKLFADRQVMIEPHVVQFLLRRMERSLSAARAVVEKLDRAALERKSRITRGLAAEVIGGAGTGAALPDD